jgi:hypothetical protein
VVLDVMLRRFFFVMSRLDEMSVSQMRVMSGHLMRAGLVVLRCLAMVLGGILVMVSGFLVMVCTLMLSHLLLVLSYLGTECRSI